MLYIKLYLVFFKIGLFAFGGGLSMLPLIEKEMLTRGWMTKMEFLDLVSIAQMTPGAIGVNSATYVGNTLLGFSGGVVATLGVSTPSVVIILLLASLLKRLKGNIYKEAFFFGLKPVTIGLIAYAAYTIGVSTYIHSSSIKPTAIGISLLALLLLYKVKINPIFIIFLSGILGFILL